MTAKSPPTILCHLVTIAQEQTPCCVLEGFQVLLLVFPEHGVNCPQQIFVCIPMLHGTSKCGTETDADLVLKAGFKGHHPRMILLPAVDVLRPIEYVPACQIVEILPSFEFEESHTVSGYNGLWITRVPSYHHRFGLENAS